jgi:ankyrin repeat protein
MQGHLEMVRFLLEAGADQEHKTDEMHTALMEASMDGHVEVARLLLDSGAQVLSKYHTEGRGGRCRCRVF